MFIKNRTNMFSLLSTYYFKWMLLRQYKYFLIIKHKIELGLADSYKDRQKIDMLSNLGLLPTSWKSFKVN